MVTGNRRLSGESRGRAASWQAHLTAVAHVYLCADLVGECGPDDRLPCENQLCEQYGLSVTAACRALLEFVKEGIVQRKAGVGTMVAPRVVRRSWSL